MTTRRAFLEGVGGGLLIAGCGGAAVHGGAPPRDPDDDADVTPAEDLMREHGLLERVLLVYEECARRIDGHQGLAPEPVAHAAAIVRRFVEDYHERLEEQHLFPRFEQAGLLADLVATLRAQHVAGRALTAVIAAHATATAIGGDDGRRALVAAMRDFVRMYRPHHAREDTVLFAALPRVIAPAALRELGELFEAEEHAKFGKAGFEGVVAEVETIEASLGIADLAAFTPRAGSAG